MISITFAQLKTGFLYSNNSQQTRQLAARDSRLVVTLCCFRSTSNCLVILLLTVEVISPFRASKSRTVRVLIGLIPFCFRQFLGNVSFNFEIVISVQKCLSISTQVWVITVTILEG